MKIGNYNLRDMQKAVYDTIKGVVSNNVFLASRPKTVSSEMTDFAVIAFPTRVYNNGGTGETTCRISLYAKDTQGIYENAAKLNTMQTALYGVLPISSDKYCFQTPTFYDGGSDNIGFHVWHFTLNVFIK